MLTPSNAHNLIATRQAVAPYARRAGLVGILVAVGFGLAWLPLPQAAAAVAGGAAALLVLLHPVWGLVALIPLIPFSSLVSLQVGGFNVGGMETLLALILFAWLLRMAVRREIEANSNRSVSLGAIYATLDRLEEKGLVSSALGQSTRERRDRARRFFKVRAPGVRALQNALTALDRMRWGLPEFEGGSRRS